MTTGVKIALGILLAAVVAGGGYYWFTQDKQGMTNNEGEHVAQEQETPNQKKMAFEEFAKQGGTYKCTVQQSVNGSTVTGTVYMDKGLLRGEFSASYGGQNMTINLIARDGYTYTWNSMMPTVGFKMKADTSAQAGNTNAAASGNITASLQTIGDYDCDPWTANSATFAIPTGITFQTVGQ